MTVRLNGLAFAMAMCVMLDATIGSAQVTDAMAATRIVLRNAKTKAAGKPRAAIAMRETYLRRPEIVDVRLSPDGRYVSFLRRGDKGVDVILQNVSNGIQTRIVAGLQSAETEWSGDGRRLWLADEQGLAVVESASRLSVKRIVKWDPRSKQRLWAVDARAPQYAIIHERVVISGAERHRYLRVDAQGRTRLLIEAALPLRNALLNAKGDLAFTAAFDGPRYETAVRRYSEGKPRELLR